MKVLVETAQERREPIPALLYNGLSNFIFIFFNFFFKLLASVFIFMADRSSNNSSPIRPVELEDEPREAQQPTQRSESQQQTNPSIISY